MRGSLQERNNKYYAVFRVNGKQKWVNLQIPTTRGNKRRAEQALNNLLVQYNSNPNMFDKIGFADYIAKWLDNVKNSVDTITYDGYKQYAEKHIIPYFKEKIWHYKMLKYLILRDIIIIRLLLADLTARQEAYL